MQRLYSAGSLTEAYLLLHQLERAGIAARVLNEHAHGALGELPFTQAFPEVWIDDDDMWARAQAVLRAFQQQPAAQGVMTCPACGESNPASFELCWRCGAPIGAQR